MPIKEIKFFYSTGGKKVLAACIAYPLFYVGHLVSLLMDYEWLPEWWFNFWYPVYNKCMLVSLDINDWGGLKLWTKATKSE